MLKFKVRILALLLCAIFIMSHSTPAPTHAQSTNFTAVQSGNWGNSATWGGSVPTGTDNVTIPAGITVTIPAGSTVTREYVPYPGYQDYGSQLHINGTLNNGGTLNNSGWIGVFGSTGTLNNSGTFNNHSTLNNSNTFNNQAGGVLNNPGGIFNSGTINNDGELNNKDDSSYAIIANYDTINNNSSITNYEEVENYGKIYNNGIITNNAPIDGSQGAFKNICPGVVIGNPVVGNPVNIFAEIPVTAPTLLSPSRRAHTTDTTPTFSWSSVTGAMVYRLTVYTADHSFAYSRIASSEASYTIPNEDALPRGTYYWHVRTQSNCNNWSGWSKRNRLTID